MKRTYYCLLVTALLLVALAIPAQAATSKNPPTVPMNPIIREGDLRRLYTEEGAFICPDGLYFGMSLDDAVELLPLSETMRPGEEAFDPRKYSELPDTAYATVNPFIYYTFEEIDDVLELVLEFNAQHELFGYWLSGFPMKLEDMSDFDRETAPMRLSQMIEIFSNAAEPLVEKGPDDLETLDFNYFETGGKLRVFFTTDDGTFCQISANVFQDTFIYNVGIGRMADWPAVAGIIEGLKEN